jgi:hypothetical protein
MNTKTSAQKPQTFNADLANLPTALAPLIPQQRWVVWRWELKQTKKSSYWTKVPYQTCDPNRNAKSNDSSTWGSYTDAIAAVATHRADGIGFMLSRSEVLSSSRSAAADLDHCVDPETGIVDVWAQKLRDEANGAYCEITVSGSGLRFIGTTNKSGKDDKIHRKFWFDRKTGAGLELYRHAERFITVSGREVGSCAKLPPFDDFIDTMLARYDGAEGEAKNRSNAFDFNNAGPQSQSNPQSIDYDEVIKNGAPEGQRSELFQACVWHLAAKGKSPEEIIAELALHPNGIGEKYIGRLTEEVTRSYSKWRSQKFAATTGASATSSTGSNSWPQIYVLAGQLPRVVNEAETALLNDGREVYQRGGLVVRPILSKLKASGDRSTWAWRIIEVTLPHMVEMLTCAAQFLNSMPDRRRLCPPTPRTRLPKPTCIVRAAGNYRSSLASLILRSYATTAPSASSRDTMRRAACCASSMVAFRRSRRSRAVTMPKRRW